MKIKIIIILCFCLFFILADLPNQFVKVKSQKNENSANACPTPTPTTRFLSYSKEFPPDEKFCQEGKKPFELSQGYQITKPPPEKNLPWEKIVCRKEDFKDKWQKYLYAILDYSFEGNLEHDWVVQNNKKRGWFHAPYMDARGVGVDRITGKETSEPMGREFVHGLTRERRTCLEELKGERNCLSSSPRFQNWAVSVYNAPGGYYIGQVWRRLFKDLDSTQPLDATIPELKPDTTEFHKGFPEGTVVIKLLFTEANDDMLAGSVEWEANINFPDATSENRQTKKLRLLQIDVAVRERENISPTGWVFGSFVFQRGSHTPISYPLAVNKGWLKFVPIGLTYGNKIGESFNEQKENLPVNQHQGCNQYLNNSGKLEMGDARTNGPIDNPNSSCIACHAAAETNKLDKFTFTNLDREYPNLCSDRESFKFWFRNVNPRNTAERTLVNNVASLDFSLQLRNGIERCCRNGRNNPKSGCNCGTSGSIFKNNGEMLR